MSFVFVFPFSLTPTLNLTSLYLSLALGSGTWNSRTSPRSQAFASASARASSTSSTLKVPTSPTPRARSVSVPFSISFAPMMPVMGTRSVSALRICFPRRSLPRGTEMRRPRLRPSFSSSFATSLASSVTGASRICSGASHSGRSPAVDSMSTPKKRSMEPKMARWIMMGRSFVPSDVVYSRSKREGSWKSACTVEHCHVRPMASLILMSILGP
mmetsp:Transcript_14541/g.43710  ORF Transcript_14541/g.43710 Transcript_14541/m.43710 type:complete len:214 (-) Transcript_14541:1274-1915(-)